MLQTHIVGELVGLRAACADVEETEIDTVAPVLTNGAVCAWAAGAKKSAMTMAKHSRESCLIIGANAIIQLQLR